MKRKWDKEPANRNMRPVAVTDDATAAGAVNYRPWGVLRSGHLQTLLSSVWPVSWLIGRRAARLRARPQELLLDCGDGVRLQAFLSSAAQGGTAEAGVTGEAAGALHRVA